MDSLLKDLADFYARLDHFLLPSSRACGICGECCKAVSALRVYPLEMENIRMHIKNELLLDKFRNFANSDVISIWGSSSGYCPFQEGVLCGIYPVRPYHCRIYGHYDPRGKSLLKGCVYQGHAISYYKREELPMIDELDRLNDAFSKLSNKP
ncbi:MAG: YkgJ family cysteine cluster protein [Pelotomaculum sp.]|nr:YkgJ family cysteine cluster protein [Pelotomaculum sp.]